MAERQLEDITKFMRFIYLSSHNHGSVKMGVSPIGSLPYQIQPFGPLPWSMIVGESVNPQKVAVNFVGTEHPLQ